jgi:hypothetical protein
MLDWSLVDLARAADVSVSSVLCFEMRGAEALFPYVAGRIQHVLEGKGITFLADEGSGCGLRLDAGPVDEAGLEPTIQVRAQDTRWLTVDLGVRTPDTRGWSGRRASDAPRPTRDAG